MTAQAWICPRCYDDHSGRPCKIQDVLSAMRARTEDLVPGPWTWSVGTVEALDYDGQPVVLFERENGHVTTRNEVAFVAHARTDMPALIAAVEAVLALHKPLHALDVATRPAHHTNVCIGCGTDDGNWQVWPCPSVRAITEALGATS